MTALGSAGVAFEEYDLPGFKTTDGVGEIDGLRVAFFKDREGNIIGLAGNS
jgi:hypothetical protein